MDASKLKQDPNARLTMPAPFKENDLVLERFDANEGLGELFEFRIDALSEEADIDFDKAIGKACTVSYKVYGIERHFNGILVEAESQGARDYFYGYRLVLRPWLWLLSRTSDCRMFQEKTAREIIEEVFSDRGFSDVDVKLTENYPKLEYCVQYRETDLAFVTRMMEQHGIYYYFEHTADKHMLILADGKSSHEQSKVPPLPYLEHGKAEAEGRQHVADWSIRRRFRTGKFEHTDYDFEKPGATLLANAEADARYTRSKMELYDFPGKYKKQTPDGEKYAKVLLQAEQALDRRRHGTGAAPRLFPGALVTLEKHPSNAENTEYFVVRGAHQISTQAYRSGGGGSEASYSGFYEFQPSERPFRMPVVTPVPLINGVQTAKVVGDGDIFTDKYGRIKVEFFWDRKKKQSCWVRVAQMWSGKNWGGQFIPRVGMEAVIDFLEGDPDQPLVIGTVYNGDCMPPYELPGNKTQSGIKSNSSAPNGPSTGYNEIKFEDKKGSELVNVQAQKDMNVLIKNDETRWTGNDVKVTVDKGNRDTTLKKGNDTLTLDMGNRDTTLKMGNDTLTLSMGNQVTDVKLGSIKETAMQKIELTVGQSKLTIDQMGIQLEGMMIKINGTIMTSVKGLMTDVKGDAMLTLKGGVTMIN